MTPSRLLSPLRARLEAMPLDRAPLRRAGLLAGLLVVLLVAGQALGPDRAAAPPRADRQQVLSAPEKGSAAPRGWTAGRALALLLLAGGAGGAWVLHRRSAPAAPRSSALEVIETHTLAPGQTLRLVACGDDVLLLSATAEAIRLLRSWPRERFDASTGGAPSFADLLADAAELPASGSPAAAPAPLADGLTGAEPPAEALVLPAAAPPAAAPPAGGLALPEWLDLATAGSAPPPVEDASSAASERSQTGPVQAPAPPAAPLARGRETPAGRLFPSPPAPRALRQFQHAADV